MRPCRSVEIRVDDPPAKAVAGDGDPPPKAAAGQAVYVPDGAFPACI